MIIHHINLPIMYCVVEYIEDDEKNCITVPKCWVENNKLYYPTLSRQAFYARKRCSSPQPDWRVMPCRILCNNIESFKAALEKERDIMSIVMNNDSSPDINREYHKTITELTNVFSSTHLYKNTQSMENHVPVAVHPGSEQYQACYKQLISSIELLKEKTETILQNQADLKASLELLAEKMDTVECHGMD